MIVYINQNIHSTENTLLLQILTEVGIYTTEGIALAVNQSVIPRTKWQDFNLMENDKITIIRATQGG
jgi:sulfur carrier protein